MKETAASKGCRNIVGIHMSYMSKERNQQCNGATIKKINLKAV